MKRHLSGCTNNDILLALDKGEEAILLLLDYSSAFDTIHHDVLIQRLRERFGIQNLSLNWFRSYITNRSQSVVIDQYESATHFPSQGVPQGSVLGPLAFTLFASPLEDIIKNHDISCMLYADDTQMYLTLVQQRSQTSIVH